MGKNARRQKRIFMVNRDFQMRYIRAAVMVAICSTALTMFLILYPLFYLNVLRFPHFLPRPFLFAAGFAALLNISMIAWLGIHLSHRIAGPVFAMVRFLRNMSAGNYAGQMRVRENDELKYLTRHLNEMAESIRVRTKEDIAVIDSVIGSLEKSPSTGDAGKMLEECKKLRGSLEDRLGELDASAAEGIA